jgi:hypothetical protein
LGRRLPKGFACEPFTAGRRRNGRRGWHRRSALDTFLPPVETLSNRFAQREISTEAAAHDV